MLEIIATILFVIVVIISVDCLSGGSVYPDDPFQG